MTNKTENTDWQETLKIDKITAWYSENQRNANAVLIGLIVIISGFLYYQKVYRPNLEKEASGQLFMAERYFGLDSMNQVLKKNR